MLFLAGLSLGTTFGLLLGAILCAGARADVRPDSALPLPLERGRSA